MNQVEAVYNLTVAQNSKTSWSQDLTGEEYLIITKQDYSYIIKKYDGEDLKYDLVSTNTVDLPELIRILKIEAEEIEEQGLGDTLFEIDNLIKEFNNE